MHWSDPNASTVSLWWLVELAAAGAVGAVFLRSGLTKVVNPRAFQRSVEEYRLLPVSAVPSVSKLVIGLELAAAGGLLLGGAVEIRRAAAMIGLALIVSFTVAIVLNLREDREIACGCAVWGADDAPIGLRHVVRNLSLAGVLVVVPGAGQLHETSTDYVATTATAAVAALATLLLLSATTVLVYDAKPGKELKRISADMVREYCGDAELPAAQPTREQVLG